MLSQRGSYCTGPDLAKDYVEWRINDQLVSLREAWLRLEDIAETAESDLEQAAEELLLWIGTSTLHPAVYQAELRVWIQVMAKRPTLADNTVERAKSSGKGFLDGFRAGWKEGRDKLNR